MNRLIFFVLALALFVACQGDSHAQANEATGMSDEATEMSVSEAAAAIDSPMPASRTQSPLAMEGRRDALPQDTLKPKSVKALQAEQFLRKRVKDEATVVQIREYLEQDEKVSAVRTISKATELELPEAKAFIDSLEVLMGTDEVKKSPSPRVPVIKKDSRKE